MLHICHENQMNDVDNQEIRLLSCYSCSSSRDHAFGPSFACSPAPATIKLFCPVGVELRLVRKCASMAEAFLKRARAGHLRVQWYRLQATQRVCIQNSLAGNLERERGFKDEYYILRDREEVLKNPENARHTLGPFSQLARRSRWIQPPKPQFHPRINCE